MNLVLGDVEETRRVLTKSEETLETGGEVEWQTEVARRGMLFVRGDAIILVAPPSRALRT
jgi:small nuclear ribonucleoprotein (snRNP)-like protein